MKKSLFYLFALLIISPDLYAIAAPTNVKIEVTNESWDSFINKAILTFDPVYHSNGAEASYEVCVYTMPFNGTYDRVYQGSQIQYSATKNKLLIPDLLPNTTYYVGVKAKYLTEQSSYVIVSVTTRNYDASVKAPTDVTIRELSGQRILTWSHTGTNITGFRITRVSPSPQQVYEVGSTVRSYNLTSSTTTPATYMYQVVAVNGGKISKSVGTGILVSSSSNLINDASVKVHDNDLLVDVLTDEPYTVNIYDISGKKVLGKSVKSNRVDISGINKGVYVVQIITSTTTITKKISKN